MTIQGAIEELQTLFNAKDVPIYYKGAIKKVIETIQMDTVLKDFHDKTCEAMAKRHTEEIQRLMPKRGEWIPCSERLPKDEGIFLVTMETYVFDEYSHPVGTSFYSPSFGWVNASLNKVLAWMPLPEPWKGADDETD